MKIFFKEFKSFLNTYFNKRKKYKLVLIETKRGNWIVSGKSNFEEFKLIYNDNQKVELLKEVKTFEDKIFNIKLKEK